MAVSSRLSEILPDRESALNNFQSRFVLPFGVFSAAVILLFGTVVTIRTHGLLAERVRGEQMTGTQMIASGLEHTMTGVADALQSIAKSPAARGDDAAAGKEFLKSYSQHDDLLSAIYVLDASGDTVIATGQAGDPAATVAQDECFGKVVKGANVCYSDLRLDQNGAYRAYVYVPVEAEAGVVRRVVAGAVPVNAQQIKGPVLGANPGIRGFAMLVDRSGNVVLNGDSSRNAPLNLKNEEIMRQALSGAKGSADYNYGPVEMLATYVTVEGPGWVVIAQRPAREVGGYGEYVGLAFLFLVFGTIGAIVLAVVQSQGVTRFLFQLTGRIDNLTRGSLDIEMSEEAEPALPLRRAAADGVEAEAEGMEPPALTSSFNRLLRSMRDERKRTEASFREAMDSAKFNQGVVESFTDLLIVVGPNMQVQTCGKGASKYCDADAFSIPGKHLPSLGSNWTQPAVQDAVRRAVKDGITQSVMDARMRRNDGVECDLALRIYPLQGRGADRNGGAVIYGMEVGEIVSRSDRMRQTEKGFRDVVNAVNDPLIILDNELKLEWMNASAARMLGTVEPGGDFRKLVSSPHRAVFEQAAVRALNTGEAPGLFESEFEAGGGRAHVEVSMCQALSEGMKQKVAITLRGVPQTRKVERSALRDRDTLERKIRYLTASLDAVPVAVALVDVGGKIVQVNRAFERMFRERREVFMGKQIGVFHAGDSRYFDLAAVAKAGSQHIETYVNAVGGVKMLAEAWAVALPAEKTGQGNAILCAFREIGTERATVERTKRDLREDAVHVTSREIANKLMPPLGGLMQSLQSLGSNIFSDQNRGMWQAALRGGKCISQSLNMLLMYSAEQPFEPGPCRIEDIIDETIEAMDRHGMLPPGVMVERDYAADLPVCEADAEQLKMVMWNLLLNSMQAVESQGADAVVQVNAYPRMNKGKQVVMVDVLDSGPDIDTTKIASFFEPFKGTREGGMGLGLTLGRMAVERHGGRLGMERKDGYTRVSFVMPVRAAAGGGAQGRGSAARSGALN